jgi:hypothetical protein
MRQPTRTNYRAHAKQKKSGIKASEQRKALMSQMQFLGQMSSTETALFHQVAAGKFGLGITDMKTLSALHRREPIPAGRAGQSRGALSDSRFSDARRYSLQS